MVAVRRSCLKTNRPIPNAITYVPISPSVRHNANPTLCSLSGEVLTAPSKSAKGSAKRMTSVANTSASPCFSKPMRADSQPSTITNATGRSPLRMVLSKGAPGFSTGLDAADFDSPVGESGWECRRDQVRQKSFSFCAGVGERRREPRRPCTSGVNGALNNPRRLLCRCEGGRHSPAYGRRNRPTQWRSHSGRSNARSSVAVSICVAVPELDDIVPLTFREPLKIQTHGKIPRSCPSSNTSCNP